MFWAAFGFGKRTELVHMKGDPNSPRGGVTNHVYLETLKTYFLPMLDDDSIFMHDNAPIHRAHIIEDWFFEEVIDVATWPPYSPDLNPQENL